MDQQDDAVRHNPQKSIALPLRAGREAHEHERRDYVPLEMGFRFKHGPTPYNFQNGPDRRQDRPLATDSTPPQERAEGLPFGGPLPACETAYESQTVTGCDA